jgi:hypothetical protein
MVLISSSTKDMEAMGFAIDEAPSSLSEGARAMPLDRKAGDTLLTINKLC